jgi:hypothetical protein
VIAFDHLEINPRRKGPIPARSLASGPVLTVWLASSRLYSTRRDVTLKPSGVSPVPASMPQLTM